MSNKFIRFQELRETTPAGLDGHQYRLSFEVGEERDAEFHPFASHQLDIVASGTLQAVWNKTDAEMADYSGTSASSYVLDLARHNRLDELQPLQLNTYTASREPPESPRIKPGTILPVTDAILPRESGSISFLSEDISELRDQINALSKVVWGGRILLLSQERPLFDMYKSANTAAEFRARVQSLGIISKDLDREVLINVIGKGDQPSVGEYLLLEEALETVTSKEVAEAICSPLKQINYLRQGYPAHGDNAKRVLDAHRFFGLSYPVSMFNEGKRPV